MAEPPVMTGRRSTRASVRLRTQQMQSAMSGWAGLPTTLLQVRIPCIDRMVLGPPCSRRCPDLGNVPPSTQVGQLCAQAIADSLEHSGHRRRMQLTCRDWAVAAGPTKLHVRRVHDWPREVLWVRHIRYLSR